MALIPHPRELFIQTPGDPTTEIIDNINKKIEGGDQVKAYALRSMATNLDTKSEDPIFRGFERAFRKIFLESNKITKTRPIDIIATLVEQEVAKRIFNGSINLSTPQGKKEMTAIEEQIFAMIPSSEVEATRVIDYMRTFDCAINAGLANTDVGKSEELWKVVDDTYANVDLYAHKKESKYLTLRPEHKTAAQTFIQGQLLGRVRDLLCPTDPDAATNQKKFAEMFEHLDIIGGLKKQDMPVHASWLSDPNLKREISMVINREVAAGKRPKVLEALELGIFTSSDIPRATAIQALTAHAKETSDGSFERLAHLLSDTGAPFANYADVVSNPQIKDAIINKAEQKLKGGTNLEEWQERIKHFDKHIKEEVLEPLSALSDKGAYITQAKIDLEVTLPAKTKELADALTEEGELIAISKKGAGGKEILDKIIECGKKIAALRADISAINTKYPLPFSDLCKREFAPYRRLSDYELSSGLGRVAALDMLASAFDSNIQWFVTLRDELLLERTHTYLKYRILQNTDLLNPSFDGRIKALAVTKLNALASQPTQRALIRKLITDHGIVSDPELTALHV